MSETVRNILFYASGALVLGWVVVVTVIKSEDPLRMIFRWIVTAGMVTFMFLKIMPLVLQAPIVALPMAGFCGIVLAVTWRRALAAIVANPFGNLFDGGNIPPKFTCDDPPVEPGP